MNYTSIFDVLNKSITFFWNTESIFLCNWITFSSKFIVKLPIPMVTETRNTSNAFKLGLFRQDFADLDNLFAKLDLGET